MSTAMEKIRFITDSLSPLGAGEYLPSEGRKRDDALTEIGAIALEAIRAGAVERNADGDTLEEINERVQIDNGMKAAPATGKATTHLHPLYRHMYDEHKLVLTDTELHDIMAAAKAVRGKAHQAGILLNAAREVIQAGIAGKGEG